MSVKITDNTHNVENMITQKGNIFLRLFAEDVVKISEPNTPKKVGNLRRDVLKEVLGLAGKIKWVKEYVGYQEKKQFKHYTTPGTGPHFAENAIDSAISKQDATMRRAGLI